MQPERTKVIKAPPELSGMATDGLHRRLRLVRASVIGDVMLDEYIIGAVSRISPEAPVPVLHVQSRKCVLGGAANVASNIAAVGSRVAITGFAAFDAAGRQLRDLLCSAGIVIEGLVDPQDRCTISKTRIVAGRQQIVRVDHEVNTPAPEAASEAVLQAAKGSVNQSDVLVLSDYAKGLLSERFCAKVIEEAQRHSVPVIVDPKGRDFRKYRGCTLITPNFAEAAAASGERPDGNAALQRAGEFLLRMLPGTGVLITQGADGMTLFRRDFLPVKVSAVARQVFDVVGAGDTVVAVLAACLGAGIAIEAAMHLANIAAGIAVDTPGTATVTLDSILSHDLISDGERGVEFTSQLPAAPVAKAERAQ